MYCMTCGAQIADDSQFCIHCGSKTFVPDQTQVMSGFAGAANGSTNTQAPVHQQAVQYVPATASMAAKPAAKGGRGKLIGAIVALVALVAVAVVLLNMFVLNPQNGASSHAAPASSSAAAAASSAASSVSTAAEAVVAPSASGASSSASSIPAGQPTTSAGIGSATLVNSEYSIRANIPSGYTLAEYYDGNAVWASSNGDMHITAGGMRNTSGWSRDSYRDYVAKTLPNIEYQPTGDGWFVFSGEDGGETYYAKYYVGSNYIKWLSFSYTSGSAGDKVIEQVYPTIDVGSL